MSPLECALYVEEKVPVRDAIARREAVRSLTGETTLLTGGVPVASEFRNFVLEYDRAGKRVRQESFDRTGRLVRRGLYDAGGQLVQDITFDAAGNPEYRFEIAYQGENWTEKRMYSPPDRLHYRISPQRDPSGRLAQAVYRDATDHTIRMDSYAYDARGRIVRVEMGNLGESTYEYDERGNLVRKSLIMPGASVLGEVYEFDYDARDLLVRMRQEQVSLTRFTLEFF
jgi:YD repeat-containing protein